MVMVVQFIRLPQAWFPLGLKFVQKCWLWTLGMAWELNPTTSVNIIRDRKKNTRYIFAETTVKLLGQYFGCRCFADGIDSEVAIRMEVLQLPSFLRSFRLFSTFIRNYHIWRWYAVFRLYSSAVTKEDVALSLKALINTRNFLFLEFCKREIPPPPPR